MRKPKYTIEELKDKIRTDALQNGIAPTFEILQRRIHVGHNTLRKLGNIKEIYTMLGFDQQLPSTASQLECSVYNLLLEFFDASDIVFQKTFAGCRTNRLLPFDFYIKSINLIVEADGTQHYAEGKAGWGARCRETDLIKNEFCRTTGIALLRIRARRFKWKLDNLRTVIKTIQLHAQETGHANCFNCWDGSDLIPISSEADVKHKPKAEISISYKADIAIYNIQGVTIKLDKNVCKQLTCGLYIKENKVYRSDTGTLMANHVLGIKGARGITVVTYLDGDSLNLCACNLRLQTNKDIPRSKRGAYVTSQTGNTAITWNSAVVRGKRYNSYVVKLPSGKKRYVNIAKFPSKEAALEQAYKLLTSERSTTIPEGSTDEVNASGNGQHPST